MWIEICREVQFCFAVKLPENSTGFITCRDLEKGKLMHLSFRRPSAVLPGSVIFQHKQGWNVDIPLVLALKSRTLNVEVKLCTDRKNTHGVNAPCSVSSRGSDWKYTYVQFGLEYKWMWLSARSRWSNFLNLFSGKKWGQDLPLIFRLMHLYIQNPVTIIIWLHLTRVALPLLLMTNMLEMPCFQYPISLANKLC